MKVKKMKAKPVTVPIELKREIVSAYYGAKTNNQKREVLERYGVTRQSAHAFRFQLRKLDKNQATAGKTGRGFRSLSAEERRPLVAEYAALSSGPAKRQWRIDHGMADRNGAMMLGYHAKMYKAKNGDLPVVQVTHGLIPASEQSPVTLDDGINALRVQRDHLDETIRMLQALKQGVLATRR